MEWFVIMANLTIDAHGGRLEFGITRSAGLQGPHPRVDRGQQRADELEVFLHFATGVEGTVFEQDIAGCMSGNVTLDEVRNANAFEFRRAGCPEIVKPSGRGRMQSREQQLELPGEPVLRDAP
jgi:hypothetical protein